MRHKGGSAQMRTLTIDTTAIFIALCVLAAFPASAQDHFFRADRVIR